jgi:hypothetical protein
VKLRKRRSLKNGKDGLLSDDKRRVAKTFAERKEKEFVTVGSFSDLTFPDPPFEELTNHFRSLG